jgi:hypothetical protein
MLATRQKRSRYVEPDPDVAPPSPRLVRQRQTQIRRLRAKLHLALDTVEPHVAVVLANDLLRACLDRFNSAQQEG